jgi:hypothetical protein
MLEQQGFANQPAQPEQSTRGLQPAKPDFAAAKAATYAQFEAARRQATTVVEASPLVRWATEELRTPTSIPCKAQQG